MSETKFGVSDATKLALAEGLERLAFLWRKTTITPSLLVRQAAALRKEISERGPSA